MGGAAQTITLLWLYVVATTTATTFESIRGVDGSSSLDHELAPVEPHVPDTLPSTSVPVPDPGLPVSDPSTARPTTYEYVEIPQATVDSNTFRKVPRRVCPDTVSNQLMHIYKTNRHTFDACAVESHYQIFPYSGTHVTDLQLRAMVKSEACRAIATVCVVARMPECDISDLPLKAVTETLLKLMVDVESGAMTVQEINRSLFSALYQWRRDVNLAQSAKVPFGNDSSLYKDFTRSLHVALADPMIHVSTDLTITADDTVDNDGDRPDSSTLDSSGALLSSTASREQLDTPATATSSSPRSSSPTHDRSSLASASVKVCRHKAVSVLLCVAAAWMSG